MATETKWNHNNNKSKYLLHECYFTHSRFCFFLFFFFFHFDEQHFILSLPTYQLVLCELELQIRLRIFNSETVHFWMVRGKLSAWSGVYVWREKLAMESDNLFDERQSIRDSARQLKKYGSTCNHVRNNEYLIRHNLQQTDTLQGIALKYGCTVRIRSLQITF